MCLACCICAVCRRGRNIHPGHHGSQRLQQGTRRTGCMHHMWPGTGHGRGRGREGVDKARRGQGARMRGSWPGFFSTAGLLVWLKAGPRILTCRLRLLLAVGCWPHTPCSLVLPLVCLTPCPHLAASQPQVLRLLALLLRHSPGAARVLVPAAALRRDVHRQTRGLNHQQPQGFAGVAAGLRGGGGPVRGAGGVAGERLVCISKWI